MRSPARIIEWRAIASKTRFSRVRFIGSAQTRGFPALHVNNTHAEDTIWTLRFRNERENLRQRSFIYIVNVGSGYGSQRLLASTKRRVRVNSDLRPIGVYQGVGATTLAVAMRESSGILRNV
jgi:hypothetical protein